MDNVMLGGLLNLEFYSYFHTSHLIVPTPLFNYPLEEWVHVFTDGSQETGSNAGYGLHCIFFEESHAMEPCLSSFDAEVKAIVRAVERIAGTVNFPLRKTKFVILSDSKAAIQSITKAENCDELTLTFKQNLVMIRMQQKQLQLQWIPSRCKIPGNEKADALAKLGSKKKLKKFFRERQREVMEGGGEKRPRQTLDSKGSNSAVPSRNWTRLLAAPSAQNWHHKAHGNI